MKKFLIMLMVVAMASFLFVGCMPGVTPGPEPEPVVPPGPTSTTPVIETIGGEVEAEGGINLYSSDIQYINKDKAKSGILVEGYAPKYSTVQVYINGIVVGTSTAYGGDEMFKVFISKTSLGVDGVKTLYATTIEVGLDESTPSTAYAFTLDTVAPEIVSVAAEVENSVEDVVTAGDKATMTVTCSEAIDEDSLVLDPVTNLDIWDISVPSLYGAETGTYYMGMDPESIQYDLVSPKVIELIGEFVDPTSLELGHLIRVSYEISEAPSDSKPDDGYVPITDLAGNGLVESVHYCYLELE